MKNIYTLLFSFYLFSSIGQECGPITAKGEFVHGKMQYNILNGVNAMNEINYKVGIGPNGDIDSREYASIVYSNNIWAGGIEQNGSIKLAAGQNIEQDWVAGPLNENGQTNFKNCQNWDRVFTVTKEDILLARKIYLDDGPCEDYPESVKTWPGRNNPFLSFANEQTGADYFDWDQDGRYNPCAGDLPVVSIRGKEHNSLAEYFSRLPSQISYYVINDAGKPHYLSEGLPIGMEVKVYIFSYQTPMTEDIVFTKYKFKSYATENLRDFHFGSWFDFDLGCSTNDYIGTDIDKNLLYVYNESDEKDCLTNDKQLPNGQFGVSYLGGVYEPYLIVDNNGVDSLVIPFLSEDVDTLVRTKMKTSIIPVNCFDNMQPNACNPQNSSEYYNILSGKNKNGSAIADNDGTETQIMYSDIPSDTEGWSLCTDNKIPETTAIITSGTPLLQQYASNEVLLALCYAADDVIGCSNIAPIKYKQEEAQKLYDNNFFNLMGPPPPIIELSQVSNAITLSISYVPSDYSKFFPEAEGFDDDKYNFEGIKIYQVSSSNFDLDELDNENLSHLIYQGDVENGVGEISNWQTLFSQGVKENQPVIKVNGSDSGIEDKIVFDYDYLNDKPVVEGEAYYFVALSYAYNNYQQFLPNEESGQKYPYLEGQCGLNILNSKTLLSNVEVDIKEPYDFYSYGHKWSLENARDHINVRLVASNGQKIKTWNLSSGHSINSNEIDNLTPGVYFLQVFSKSTQRQYAHKIVLVQ